MKIYTTIDEIQHYLKTQLSDQATIGFVPTMGALHEGHLSLLKKARSENKIVVCSIFVNPIQFNNKEDFDKYPQTIDNDIQYLENANCDILFHPSVNEMYPEKIMKEFDWGELDKILEGKFRPGHFNGVGIVLEKLFNIIKPHRAYFGEKDYQQLLITKKLVNLLNLSVQIITCSTVREKDGLAMSSRNMRLTDEERQIAPVVYQILLQAKEQVKKESVDEIKRWVIKELQKYPVTLDYFEIADAENLRFISNWKESTNSIALIAWYLGKIRLIDNIYIS